MGGSDTIRGITYQHACAIAASLDVVEDPRSVAIRIEASDDVVDFDILDVNKRCLRIAQVKTKAEPDAFSAAEIVQVLELVASFVVQLGHLSRRMLEHYSHIRIDARRQALDALDVARRAIAGNRNGNGEPANEAEIQTIVGPRRSHVTVCCRAGLRPPINC